MDGRRPFRAVVGAAAVLLLAGCQLSGDTLPPPPVNQPTAAGAPAGGSGSTAGGGLLHAGRGWTATGIVGVFPPAGSCHLRFTPAGEPLPDPRCTPGVADQAVTQQNLPDTVCREGGYTRTVRPPRAVTDAAKDKLLAAYGIARSHTREYELDHLLDLASGGSSAVQNLFPQPNILKTATGSAYVHNDKDRVEAYTFHALCAGKVTLAAVQQAMTSNWTTAVKSLGLPMIPAGYTG